MNIKRILTNIFSARPEKEFYVIVKCHDCGEEVKTRINRGGDFQAEYNVRNPKYRYTVKKEVIGKNCFNLMKLTLALTKNSEVLFADTKGCDFLEFNRE
ncbi:MAG: hypothetical protein KKH08_06250 [Candidatus Omnitrophica bacterium]|nr:hypothetical protein [Candidatus Omnitrophota bacterium]